MSNKEKKVRKPEDSDNGFRFVRAIVNPLYKFWYNPKVIGAENIPDDGAIIVAGNHMHIMDQCNVFLATKDPSTIWRRRNISTANSLSSSSLQAASPLTEAETI